MDVKDDADPSIEISIQTSEVQDDSQKTCQNETSSVGVEYEQELAASLKSQDFEVDCDNLPIDKPFAPHLPKLDLIDRLPQPTCSREFNQQVVQNVSKANSSICESGYFSRHTRTVDQSTTYMQVRISKLYACEMLA